MYCCVGVYMYLCDSATIHMYCCVGVCICTYVILQPYVYCLVGIDLGTGPKAILAVLGGEIRFLLMKPDTYIDSYIIYFHY